eukprot:SAG22_NODE_2653_length_2336_cov_2.233110_2_plen_292_part_00
MAAETLALGPVVWRAGAQAALERAAAAPGVLTTLRGANEAAAVAAEVLQWDIRSAAKRTRDRAAGGGAHSFCLDRLRFLCVIVEPPGPAGAQAVAHAEVASVEVVPLKSKVPKPPTAVQASTVVAVVEDPGLKPAPKPTPAVEAASVHPVEAGGPAEHEASRQALRAVLEKNAPPLPSAKATAAATKHALLGALANGATVLTVGDGDFSFTALSFGCASTWIVSKTVPFHVVPQQQVTSASRPHCRCVPFLVVLQPKALPFFAAHCLSLWFRRCCLQVRETAQWKEAGAPT